MLEDPDIVLGQRVVLICCKLLESQRHDIVLGKTAATGFDEASQIVLARGKPLLDSTLVVLDGLVVVLRQTAAPPSKNSPTALLAAGKSCAVATR